MIIGLSQCTGQAPPRFPACDASAEFGWSKAEKSFQGFQSLQPYVEPTYTSIVSPTTNHASARQQPNLPIEMHLDVLGLGLFRLRSSATMVLGYWLGAMITVTL
jgi:hypothetical protein